MSWRATTTVPDRIFASLAYLLPLFYVMPFGGFLFELFPPLQALVWVVLPVALIYSIPFAGLLVFMLLYLLVVRNNRVSLFIRYNTMQALLMGIVLFIVQLLVQLLLRIASFDLLIKVLFNFIFIATVIGVVYGVVQSVRGIYAEIPTLSEATKSQVF
ncbi:Tic20 family protein [Thermosynechococcus vestitus]|uniref:Ycf60 protein n=2 Tax=Thermosynechococcus vestitus TaxID=146786 RepID=Q8DJZ7_THEVB|nr:Tic20 family protein [Thermosynechococcus vestitus]BAC08626.1 ycf60 [Thermosynechococcus vestitus BP-1]